MAKFHTKVVHGYDSIGSGRQTATPFGTPVSLASSSTPFKVVLITPLASNTNVVVVGDINIVATPVSSRRGYVVATPEGVKIEGDDLTDIYIQTIVAEEGVSFTYYK